MSDFSSLLPPEIYPHKIRLSTETLSWLEANLERNLSLQDFAERLFNLIAEHEIIDAEIAYMAVKAGVMTSKLSKVIDLGEAKHPAIKAYQALALLFRNNFSLADDYLEEAEAEAERMDDILVLAEVFGIKIYLFNARYQFFQGIKIIQKAFEFFDSSKNKQLVEKNPSFLQWIRISGAKSLLKLGNLPEALYTNKRALKLSNDRFFKSFSLLGIGHCFDLIGKTAESIKYYQKALKEAYEVKSYNLISIIYNRLGMAVAWRMDKLIDGENYFSEAIQSAERGECFWLKEGPQWNLIALYRAKKDYNSAIHEIENIIESTRKIGESRTELIALLNLGELLEEKGDLREATKVRDAADSLASIIGIDVEEFYESDDQEESDEDDDEIDNQEDDETAEYEYDNSDEANDKSDYNGSNNDDYEYFERDDAYYKEEDDSSELFARDNGNPNYSIDENSLDGEDDSDDILRKFFEKKKR